VLVVDFHKSVGDIAIDPHESCVPSRQCQFADESSGGLILECRMLFLAWQRSQLATRILSEKSRRPCRYISQCRAKPRRVNGGSGGRTFWFDDISFS
jgi:hypothetical protein